jgi:hypothetical protein
VLGRFEPECRRQQEIEQLVPQVLVQKARQFRTVQNARNLVPDRFRECDIVFGTGLPEGLARGAVRLDRRADQGGGVEDDQLRRSALSAASSSSNI